MFTVIADFDVTNHIDPQNYEVFLGIIDDLPSFKFDLDDNGSLITLTPGMEVLVYDETLTDVISSIPMIPARNILANPAIDTLSGWTAGGTLSSTITANTPDLLMATQTFSNNAVGTGYYYQNTQLNYVQPGQTYTFSYRVQITTNLVNAQAFGVILFFDGAMNQLQFNGDYFITTPGNALQRRSLTVTAPAGAVYAQVQWGGQTTSTTNSGTIVWGISSATQVAFQLEPNWFVDQGVSYPSPDLGFNIVGSGAELPDGTASRRCRVFAGYIDDLQVEYEGTNRIYHVSCAGPGWVLENFNLLDATYATPTYDSVIINNFLTASYTNVLTGAALFYTASPTIIQGALIDANTYADLTFREVLNTLTDTSGYIYWVDAYYHLHHTPYYWDIAPVIFNTNTNAQDYVTVFPPREYKIESDLTQIKNRIKVTGAQQDQTVNDKFNGDGSTIVFNLTQIPNKIASCTVGGATQNVGVAGVATLGVGGVIALVDPSNKQLTFQTAPASGTNNVLVTYTSPQPVAAQVQSLDSFAQYGNRYWDSKVNDSSLTSVQAAHLRGLAELQKYQYALVTLTFKTDQSVLAGQILLFTSAADGYTNSPFLARRVYVRHLGNGQNEYEIEAGPYQPDMLDTFRNVHKALNRSQGVAFQLVPVLIYLVANDTTAVYTESIRITATPTPNQYGTAYYGYGEFS